MSSTDTVSPDWLAYSKLRFLEGVEAASHNLFGVVLGQPVHDGGDVPALVATWFTYGKSWGRVLLKNTLPTVVGM